MRPSMFNLRVPLPARDEVFLMNTLTDAQLIVSNDVAALLDQELERDGLWVVGGDKREAVETLVENGFLVPSREYVGSSRVDLQACKLEYSIVSPK